jgi:subtilisin family serine protease/uncharacterized protein YjdB
MSVRSRSVFGLALAVVLTACGGGDGPTGPTSITTVNVTAANQTLTALGATVQLTAEAKNAKGKTVGGTTFDWSSSDPSVAQVSNGVVTAVKNGTAQISATANSQSGRVTITVAQVVTSVGLTFPSDTIYSLDDTLRAAGTGRDARGSAVPGAPLTWTSSNTAVVTVAADGLMRSVTEGSATIAAISGALRAEKTVQVKQKPARLNFSARPATARAGLPFTTAPVVEVVDSRGQRLAADNSTLVTLSAPAGVVLGTVTRSVQGGLVAFPGTAMGATAGVQILRATAPNLGQGDASIQLTAGDPARITANPGTTNVLAATDVVLTATVRDGYDNPAGPASVVWEVMTGQGTLPATQTPADAAGQSSNTFRMSRFVGDNVVRVTLNGTPTAQATFLRVGTPNATISGSITSLPLQALSAARASVRTSSAAAPALRAPLDAFARVTLAPARATTTKLRRSAFGQRAAEVRASVTIAPEPPSKTVPGEFIVLYRGDRVGAPATGSAAFKSAAVMAPVRDQIEESLETLENAGALQTMGVSPTILAARVRLTDSSDAASTLNRLRSDPRVLSVEPNATMHAHVAEPAYRAPWSSSALSMMTQSSFTRLTMDDGAMLYPGGGLFPTEFRYPYQSWHYNLAGLPRAWQITTGSSNVLVAVVDDGIRFDHPMMAGMLTADGYDFVSMGSELLCAGGTIDRTGDGDGYDNNPTIPSSRSFNGNGTCLQGINSDAAHGLHVSGTIGAASGNSFGLVGINRQVRIRPVRVLGIAGSGTTYDIMQGVLYAAGLPADNGRGGLVQATVGARIINMSLGGSGSSPAYQLTIQQASAAGALIIASAGNNNTSVPNYPAAYDEVVSVAAVGPTMARAPYSSFGPTVEIAAPGGDLSVNEYYGVWSSRWDFVNNAPKWTSLQGTSMAAPHVTGIAALILSQFPSLSSAQLRARLSNYAIDLAPTGRDVLFGYGLINARNSLTQSLRPNGNRLVMLVDANTGAVVRTTPLTTSGSFSIGLVPDGNYWVFVGEDEMDNLYGLAGRVWGAYGAAAVPSTIVVNGAATYPTNGFTYAAPVEYEPNATAATANELMVDGHIMGTLGTVSDFDVYRVRVTQPGRYTFLAEGQVGACAFSNEADPIMTVYNAAGTKLAELDDLDQSADNYCSQIDLTLTPGTYFVSVTAYSQGRYVVSARKN